MFQQLTSRLGTLALLSILSAACGCMTHPGNGESVGRRVTPVQFIGYTQNPNQKVAVWARTSSGSWQRLGLTQSANWQISQYGSSWYAWNLTAVIPTNCWRSASSSGNLFSAELAATTSAGEVYTFQQGFDSYFSQYNSVSDMYSAHGAGTRVTVYATP